MKSGFRNARVLAMQTVEACAEEVLELCADDENSSTRNLVEAIGACCQIEQFAVALRELLFDEVVRRQKEDGS